MFDNFFHRVRRALPATCIVCGLAADREFSLCRVCESALPRLGDCCRRCGVAFAGAASQDSCCRHCLRSPPSFETCRAAFPYATPISALVAQFKFSARFDVGFALASVLAQAFNAYYGEAARPQLLLPVPLHPRRLNSRGFNQSREVCAVLSRCCRVATANSVIQKTRHTTAQTALRSAHARKGNLRGAFALGNPKPLEGRTHIALVDDVVTTMATVEAISALLQAQRDYRIDVWCLARANR